jgi:hypothetical protein
VVPGLACGDLLLVGGAVYGEQVRPMVAGVLGQEGVHLLIGGRFGGFDRIR